MWKRLLNFISVLLEKLHHPPVDLTLQRLQTALLLQLLIRKGAERHHRTATQNGLDLHNMLPGRLVLDREGATRVVTDHPPDHAAVGRRGVRAKLQAPGRRLTI